MRASNTHIVRVTLLLAVFLFALTAQSIHQLDNPIEAPIDCQTSDKHFHHNSNNHSCEICDYQVTHWTSTLVISKSWPQVIMVDAVACEQNPCIQSTLPFSRRGPPVV